MSAATGPGPDDALPEGFTVPDDLSALFDDGPETAPATPAAGDAPDARADGGGPDASGAPAEADAPAGTVPAQPSGPDIRPQDPSPAAPSAGPTPDEAAPPSDDVPDDLSSLTEPAAAEAPSVTLVLTQVAAAAPLAAACALAGVEVDVVPSRVGALAVLRDARTGADAAGAISKLLKTVPVILLERRSGQITATRWAGGLQGDELPAGLVLSDAPPELEDLLLGGTAVADLEGVVTSVGLSRWKAMRLLAQSARGMRG